jgi:hypothetical protein
MARGIGPAHFIIAVSIVTGASHARPQLAAPKYRGPPARSLRRVASHGRTAGELSAGLSSFRRYHNGDGLVLGVPCHSPAAASGTSGFIAGLSGCALAQQYRRFCGLVLETGCRRPASSRPKTSSFRRRVSFPADVHHSHCRGASSLAPWLCRLFVSGLQHEHRIFADRCCASDTMGEAAHDDPEPYLAGHPRDCGGSGCQHSLAGS